MKGCAAISRVMTFRSGDVATHENTTYVTHLFKCFISVSQPNAGVVHTSARRSQTVSVMSRKKAKHEFKATSS